MNSAWTTPFGGGNHTKIELSNSHCDCTGHGTSIMRGLVIKVTYYQRQLLNKRGFTNHSNEAYQHDCHFDDHFGVNLLINSSSNELLIFLFLHPQWV